MIFLAIQNNTPLSAVVPPPRLPPSPPLQVCTNMFVNYLPFEFSLEHLHSFPSIAWIISLAPPLFWASPLQFHVTCTLLLSLLLKSISFIPRASINEVYTILIRNTCPKVFCAGERTFLPSLPFHSKIMIVRLTRWFELQICLDSFRIHFSRIRMIARGAS